MNVTCDTISLQCSALMSVTLRLRYRCDPRYFSPGECRTPRGRGIRSQSLHATWSTGDAFSIAPPAALQSLFIACSARPLFQSAPPRALPHPPPFQSPGQRHWRTTSRGSRSNCHRFIVVISWDQVKRKPVVFRLATPRHRWINSWQVPLRPLLACVSRLLFTAVPCSTWLVVMTTFKLCRGGGGSDLNEIW